jgi:hypothetical protein
MAEVQPQLQADLRSAVEGSQVVLLLDDSGSMSTRVRPPPGSPSSGNPNTTRWSELIGDVAQLLELVTALKPNEGVDVHFMNRPGVTGVTNAQQLNTCFSRGPGGGTPMIGSLRKMFQMYGNPGRRVLLILVTDGEPSDGSYNQLFRTLQSMPSHMYLSMVECNDNEEEMEYLSGWDTKLARFHNQEDYGAELDLVRRAQGRQVKFTRANYIQMIVLSPIYPQYAIDVRGLRNSDCCTIL